MFKRILAVVGVGGVLVAASVAAAAALEVNGPNGDEVVTQAGSASDFICDEDGVTATPWLYESSNEAMGGVPTFSQIRVTGIDAACEGFNIGYAIEDGAGGDLAVGAGVIPAGGTFLTTLPNPIPAADIEEITIVINSF